VQLSRFNSSRWIIVALVRRPQKLDQFAQRGSINHEALALGAQANLSFANRADAQRAVVAIWTEESSDFVGAVDPVEIWGGRLVHFQFLVRGDLAA
jgi:hypothetical protein